MAVVSFVSAEDISTAARNGSTTESKIVKEEKMLEPIIVKDESALQTAPTRPPDNIIKNIDEKRSMGGK